MSGYHDIILGRVITVFNYELYKSYEVFCIWLEYYFDHVIRIGSSVGFSVTLLCLLSIMKSSEYG
jgi:hypothetical protein